LELWKGEEDDNKKKWEVLRNILVRSSQNRTKNSQLAHSIQDESNCELLHVAGDTYGPADCNKSVRCSLFTGIHCGEQQLKSHI
jgi:hypothetical protein